MTDADRARESRRDLPLHPSRSTGVIVALVAAWLVAAPAQAQYFVTEPLNPPLSPLYAVPGYPPPSCYSEVRIFDTLKYGPTTLCRQNMKYRPGSLECVQIVDQVCGSYQVNGQWIEGRNIVTTNVIPCPQGPPQPMCPQLGGTGIRGRRSFIR